MSASQQIAQPTIKPRRYGVHKLTTTKAFPSPANDNERDTTARDLTAIALATIAIGALGAYGLTLI